MKNFKKISAILLAGVMALPMVACGGGNNGGAGGGTDPKKTTLYVGTYGDAGSVPEYMQAMAKRFSDKYKGISFEEGKEGVEVKIIPSRYGGSLEYNIQDLTVDVFVGTSANANYLGEKDLLLDITDVYEKPFAYDFVTGKTDPNGDQTTVKENIREDLREYFKSEKDGKYYGYPGSTSYYGLIYDIDLFESENLYFAKDGGFVTSATDARSAGPDGDFETKYDNGLPATYDDFFALCDKMVSKNITPVMWGGNVQEYVSSLLMALAADCDGKEQVELNYNYNGVATTLIESFNGDTPVLAEPKTITAQNGYELYKTTGRYYALKFLERLLSNPKYYNSADATNNAFDHLMAQDMYLLSKYGDIRQRTAMLVDGSWWQKEALGTFQAMAAENGEVDSEYQRRFGMLPLPKPTAEKVGEPFTLLERCVGDGFINANVPSYKVNLAKSFVQMMYSDAECIEHVKVNSTCMPVSIEIGDEYDELTPWGQNSYDLLVNADMASMYSTSTIMKNYSSKFWYSPEMWYCKSSQTTYVYPSKAMIDYNVTAKNYFTGMSAYWTESMWLNTFTAI